MKLKDTFIAVVALAIVGLLGYVWFSPAGVKAAPDIELVTLKEGRIKLSALQGQPVLITFWATSCPGCIKEIPHLVELHEKLGPRGLKIIGINMQYDPPNLVTEFIKQRHLPYTIAMDIDGSASRGFGDIRLTPTSFLIAPDGRIVFQKIGEMDIHALTARIETLLTNTQAAL